MSIKVEAINVMRVDGQPVADLPNGWPEYTEMNPDVIALADPKWLSAQWPGGIITILGTEYTVIGMTEMGNFLLRRGFHVHCGGCEAESSCSGMVQ